MTSAMEKLRKLLDERGVKWEAPKSACADLQTFFNVGRLYVTADSLWYDKERLSISMSDTLTPEQAIAATLGRDTKPCYAAEKNYKRCKYSVNRGWCDDAPFLVWDDTGHLFITMGGLKTWDVTDDAKKWFAELGSGTCSIVKTWSDSDYVDDWRYRCSECGGNIPVNERDPETGDVINAANYCPNCGRKVVGA